MSKVFFDTTYRAVPEQSYMSCAGCAAYDNQDMCDAMRFDPEGVHISLCTSNSVIWTAATPDQPQVGTP